MSILYALACFGFSAGNDFVFKLYARKLRSRGWYVAMIGTVWLALMGWFPPQAGADVAVTLWWGTISGIFSVAANLMLIEAMTKQSAGVCATIYRLNLVLVVAGAALCFGETLSWWRYGGVALAVLAVLGFLPDDGDSGAVRGTGLALVVVAAVFRAGMGLSCKEGLLAGADRNGIVLVNAAMWVAGGIAYALGRERDFTALRLPKLWGYGTLSGILVAGIVLFMALALQYGEAAIVLPIAQMSFLATFGLSVWLLHERVTPVKLAALGAGGLALLLLSV